jgi:putative flippase GtrA
MIKKFIKAADRKIDFRKFIKFGMVGVMNTGVDWLAFAFLIEILNAEPRVAQVAAQSLAIVNSYVMNKRWTFRDRNAHGKSAFKFAAVQGASLLLGYLNMLLFHDTLGVNE